MKADERREGLRRCLSHRMLTRLTRSLRRKETLNQVSQSKSSTASLDLKHGGEIPF